MRQPDAEAALGRVLVTGANGFIGRHLCAELVARGFPVVGLARSRRASFAAGVTPAYAPDLLDRASLTAALDRIETVVHLAARVHAGGGDSGRECRRVNVEGTQLLLDEATRAGVRTFLYASSVKAVAAESDTILSESTPPAPGDAYGESKLEAERAVRVVSIREGIRAPVLRLPLVYGPGVKSNMLRLFQAVAAGIPLPLASVRNRRSFAFVGNVVEAMLALLLARAAPSGPYFVSDGEDLSTPQLIRRIGNALGRKARLVPMPPALLRRIARTGYLLSRIAPFHLSSDPLSAVLGSLFVDNSHLRNMTGFRPSYTVDQGLALTAQWYRARATAD